MSRVRRNGADDLSGLGHPHDRRLVRRSPAGVQVDVHDPAIRSGEFVLAPDRGSLDLRFLEADRHTPPPGVMGGSLRFP